MPALRLIEGFAEAELEVTDDLVVVEGFWIEEAAEGETVEDAADGEGVEELGFGGFAGELGDEEAKLRDTGADTDEAVEVGEAAAALRVANGVELEFEAKEDALLILAEFGEVFAERVDALVDGGEVEEAGDKEGQVAGGVLFEDGEEEIFLVLEVVVEGSAGFAGGGGDLFKAGVLEAVAGEDGAGRGEELFAGEDAAGLEGGGAFGGFF